MGSSSIYKHLSDEEKPKPDLKKRIAAAAGVNQKTVERGARNMITVLFGVSEKDLQGDIYLREFVNWLATGEKPKHVILSSDTMEEKKES
jgi:hypothetical protein